MQVVENLYYCTSASTSNKISILVRKVIGNNENTVCSLANLGQFWWQGGFAGPLELNSTEQSILQETPGTKPGIITQTLCLVPGTSANLSRALSM